MSIEMWPRVPSKYSGVTTGYILVAGLEKRFLKATFDNEKVPMFYPS
jgi:hypothetical protein